MFESYTSIFTIDKTGRIYFCRPKGSMVPWKTHPVLVITRVLCYPSMLSRIGQKIGTKEELHEGFTYEFPFMVKQPDQ